MLRVCALVGSLRSSSLNRRLFELACDVAPGSIAIAEAPIGEIPLYNDDLYSGSDYPPAVLDLRSRLAEADAILIVSPEYNYSMPGVLKNAIDWASRGSDQPFAGKAVAIMGASPGRLGTARMQYHLRQTLVFLNAYPINKPEVMVTGARSELGAEAEPSEMLRSIVHDALQSLEQLSLTLATQTGA